MTRASAETLLFCLIPAALLLSYCMGDVQFKASATLMSLVWLYNDLRGADFGPFVRNTLNACGVLSFSIGGTAVAVSTDNSNALGGSFSPTAVAWFAMPVMFWSLMAPAYWGLPWQHLEPAKIVAEILVLCAGVILALVVTSSRSLRGDEWVWKLWCLWSATLFVLPLLASAGQTERGENYPGDARWAANAREYVSDLLW